MDTNTHHHGVIEYVQSGKSPELLILSGMHGNEAGVIGCVEMSVKNPSFPFPYFHLPRTSPSAVSAATRLNRWGHDINRCFLSPAADPEAQDCMSLLSGRTFRLCLDFHEDPDLEDAFYLYDSGQMTGEELAQMRAAVLGSGVSLFSGVDDEADAALGYQVSEGYISFAKELNGADTGFSSGWLIRHGVADRVITLEIPGRATKGVKQRLVDALFAYFLPWLA